VIARSDGYRIKITGFVRALSFAFQRKPGTVFSCFALELTLRQPSVLVHQIAWKVVLWLALNLSDARTVLSASQEHLFVELLRLLQSRGLLLTWRTKQQRHELFVQFVREQSVTKCRRVMVPFGDHKCVAVRHRVEGRR
jgi:hypothetical protein